MSDLPLEIDCQSVKQKFDEGDDFLLLDCRESDECAVAKIRGATSLPMSEIAERLGELEPHRRRLVVVHCHHGGRSLRVTQWLRENGFLQTQSMAGGIDAWASEIDANVPRY
jgi:rhodanese-related sulfurtransferase